MKSLHYGAWLAGLLTACQPARTVLIRNYSTQPLTLVFPAARPAVFLPVMPPVLRFAPTGARQDTVLTYGPGSWSKADQTQLQQLLAHSRLVIGADTLALGLYGELITRYRVPVNEFYLKINGPVPGAGPTQKGH